MKKILLLLVIACIGNSWATQVACATFKGTTWGTSDTAIANANFTIDTSVTIGALFFPAGQTYTLTNSGTQTITLSNTGVAWKDSSSGAKTYPPSIVFNGASSRLVISNASSAITATNTDLTFNGTTSCELLANNAITVKSITLGASAVLTYNGSANYLTVSGPAPFTFTNGGTFTCNKVMTLQLTASGNVPVISAGTPTINGSGTIAINQFGNSVVMTIPAITTTGTLNIIAGVSANYTGTAVNLAGNLSCAGNVTLGGSGAGTIQQITTNTNGFSVSCGTLTLGGSSATGTNYSVLNCSTSVFTVSSFVGSTTAKQTTINMATSTWTCSGNWTFGPLHTIIGSVTQSVTITNTSTVTSNGKTFPGYFVCNASAKTIAFADKFKCAGNLTLTAGKVAFFKGRDSVLGDYTNSFTATTDTVNKIDTMYNFGSWTRSSGAHTKNDTAQTMYSGTALCNLTFGDASFRINMARLTGDSRAKQVKFIDNGGFKFLKDSTGTIAFNSTGMKLTVDSSLFIVDSLYAQYQDTITTPKLLISSTAKVNNNGLFYFAGTSLDTVWNSNILIGNLAINKTGNGLSQIGLAKYDTLFISDGTFYSSDTAYCDVLIWTSTDSSTLAKPIVVSEKITVAASAKIGYATASTGSIVMAACVAATLNGNAVRIYYPTIAPISYASAPWSDTVGKTSTHAITIGGCSLGRDSIVKIGTWPTGYTINASTGLVSWDGTGSAQAAGNYVVRAYANAKIDSASVTVSIGIISISTRRRNSSGLNFGLGVGVQ